MSVLDRLQHAWNAFANRDPTEYRYKDIGVGSSYRPDRPRLSRGNERSIVTSVYNRISLDVAAISIKHVRLDNNDRYLTDIDSGLNNCLTLEANLDQTSRAFIQDAVISMFDEGYVALVPTDTTTDPMMTNAYDINAMRTGQILEWYPSNIKVRVYNEKTGKREDITIPKRMVSIIENPLYAVINEPNSTMQRLIRKLNILDAIDEQSGAGKLDLIIQLPYIIKTDARRAQAEQRRKDIESQLSGSKYGIAYTDGTEHITQLNRSVDNNLMKQIEYLTSMLYSQLGITQTILDGTADDKTMLNYNNRTIEPILSAIVDEMKRKFLTKTARSQKQSILFFRDPFKLVPVSEIAEIADKFTRNEIASSNDIRQVIGWKPAADPKADELRNKNLNQSAEEVQTEQPTEQPTIEDTGEQQYLRNVGDLDDLDEELNKLESDLLGKELKHYASEYYDPVKAHEYYEKTKELQGRKSVAKLNDSGRAAAKYVKDQLTTERKAKVNDHQNKTQAQIDAEKESMQSKIESERNSVNSEIESNKDQMQSKIESERNSVNSEIESHKNQMQTKIDALRTQLKGMSTADKKLNSEKIQELISGLREENAEARTKLRNDFKTKSSDLRTDNANKRDGLRNEQKQTSDTARADYKNVATGLRSDHKENRTNLKNEYDEKYMQELEKIRANKAFTKQTKRKTSKKSS